MLLVRRPRGVIGVITPWNWPYTMPAELIAPALASGNAVVWTPASSTAVAAVALAECVVEADLPPGVFNLVTGPGSVVGDEIARNPGTHGVGFIGSTETGRKVAEAAAGKAAVLELGGNGPVVVMDDADLELAAEATVTACFLCAGQSCTAGERLLVHRDVREEFVARLATARRRARRARRSVRRRHDDGPAEQRGRRREDGRARRGRARARRDRRRRRRARRRVPDATSTGSRPCSTASRPTALVAQEETFGPIAPVVAIDSLDEAIWLANASPYGLLSAIFTRDLAQGLRFADEVRTGWVNINDSSNYWESHLPFGGRAGTASGIGRVGGTGADGGVHRAADRSSSRDATTIVIVGGGSAGCALAARLTEDPSHARAGARGGADRTPGGTSTSTCRRRSRSRSATASTTGSTSRSRSRS